MAKKRALVFAVPGSQTGSGKHEVIFAADGDLNKAVDKGNVKKFNNWNDAEGFAHEKGKELEGEVMVHSYRNNPTYTTKYKRMPKRKSPLPRRKMARITPKRPKLKR